MREVPLKSKKKGKDERMENGKFRVLAAVPGNPNWEKLVSRKETLYHRGEDIRTEFGRDYTRILHSMAYRRLKHKTQVFFNIDNDHICTRMEHVSHVESVSSTIAKALGLNDELTKAISIGHDLGHAPFGHQGEVVIRGLTRKYLGKDFWHEQNGLRFVDSLELLEDTYKVNQNLNLTYAVRDGILSHCGEVDQNGIFPRDISIGLEEFTSPGKYQAVTWEGCVVKMADKIAYVGRDIEDALALGILNEKDREELLRMARYYDQNAMNTTVIMHNMIMDICKNSDPENGIRLSAAFAEQLDVIKKFNYEHIYKNKRLTPYVHYSELVLKELFAALYRAYGGEKTWKKLDERSEFAPSLFSTFSEWLARYCDEAFVPEKLREKIGKCKNEKVFGRLETRAVYAQAVIDFLSGMTDRFAISLFGELLQFGFHG